MAKLIHLSLVRCNFDRRPLCRRANIGSARHLFELGSRCLVLHGLQQTKVLFPHVVVKIIEGIEGRPHSSELDHILLVLMLPVGMRLSR